MMEAVCQPMYEAGNLTTAGGNEMEEVEEEKVEEPKG